MTISSHNSIIYWAIYRACDYFWSWQYYLPSYLQSFFSKILTVYEISQYLVMTILFAELWTEFVLFTELFTEFLHQNTDSVSNITILRGRGTVLCRGGTVTQENLCKSHTNSHGGQFHILHQQADSAFHPSVGQ